MDEITLFASLRPPAPTGPGAAREEARDRLSRAMQAAGPGSHHPMRGGRPPLRRGRLALAGAVAAAAAGAAVLLPALGTGHGPGSFSTAAWAVQRNPDGTVTLTVRDISDPAGLQRALSEAGVRARVASPPMKVARTGTGQRVYYPVCGYPQQGRWYVPPRTASKIVDWRRSIGPAGQLAVIHPVAMPPGSVLFISDSVAQSPGAHSATGVFSRPGVLKSGTLPPCVPAPVP